VIILHDATDEHIVEVSDEPAIGDEFGATEGAAGQWTLGYTAPGRLRCREVCYGGTPPEPSPT